MKCPECSSDKIAKDGFGWGKRDGVRVRVQRYRCTECGRIFREKEESSQ